MRHLRRPFGRDMPLMRARGCVLLRREVSRQAVRADQSLPQTTICAKRITEMRGADLMIFFELIKSVIFVISCGSNFFELIKMAVEFFFVFFLC